MDILINRHISRIIIYYVYKWNTVRVTSLSYKRDIIFFGEKTLFVEKIIVVRGVLIRSWEVSTLASRVCVSEDDKLGRWVEGHSINKYSERPFGHYSCACIVYDTVVCSVSVSRVVCVTRDGGKTGVYIVVVWTYRSMCERVFGVGTRVLCICVRVCVITRWERVLFIDSCIRKRIMCRMGCRTKCRRVRAWRITHKVSSYWILDTGTSVV